MKTYFFDRLAYSKLWLPGSPLKKTLVARVIDFDYQVRFQINCWLREDLVHSPTRLVLHSTCDGTGTDKSLWTAWSKSVSEALERWAFYQHGKSKSFGFDTDSTTSGMACLPGRTNKVREIAFFEALERWSLRAWWHEELACYFESKVSFGANTLYRYTIPFDANVTTVILRTEVVEGSIAFDAYGFACAENIQTATAKAITELSRNIRVLKKFYGSEFPEEIVDPNEIQLIRYSSIEGRNNFLKKVSKSVIGSAPIPRLVFDGKIAGEWDKYASIWRCVFSPSFPAELQEDEFYF